MNKSNSVSITILSNAEALIVSGAGWRDEIKKGTKEAAKGITKAKELFNDGKDAAKAGWSEGKKEAEENQRLKEEEEKRKKGEL